jgi:hypothetical protein
MLSYGKTEGVRWEEMSEHKIVDLYKHEARETARQVCRVESIYSF